MESTFLCNIRKCRIWLTSKNPRDINIKIALNNLIRMITKNQPEMFTEMACLELTRLVRETLFRSHPSISYPSKNRWQCLQLVYVLLFKFFESSPFKPNIAARAIDKEFVLQVFQLLESSCQKECEYVKSIISIIYFRLPDLNDYIFKQINFLLLRYIYEAAQFNGIGQLLEILKTVMENLELLTEKQQKYLFEKILIPFHKTKNIYEYWHQFRDCVQVFLEKYPSLKVAMVHGILKYWPRNSTLKETKFIQEIKEIIAFMNYHQFKQIQEVVLKHLSNCTFNINNQVSKEALAVFKDQHVLCFLKINIREIMPIIFFHVQTSAEKYWEGDIPSAASKLLELLKSIDPLLFRYVQNRYKNKTVTNKF